VTRVPCRSGSRMRAASVVGTTGRIHHVHRMCTGRAGRCLSPPSQTVPRMRPSPVCGGTRSALRPSRGRRSAPGRRAQRKARDPGGPGRPLAGKRQQWRGPAGRLKWLKVCSPAAGNGTAGGKPKQRTGTQIAVRGCCTAAPGTPPGSQGSPLPEGSQGRPGRACRGRRQTGPWAAARHPRNPPHPRALPRGRTARA